LFHWSAVADYSEPIHSELLAGC